MGTAMHDWIRANRITVACPHGSIRASIARTFAARFSGLLTRKSLADDEGLLFVPGGSIHTLGMRFAIDIVFLSAQLDVLKVAACVPASRFVMAPPRTQFVLEVASRVAQTAGLTIGTTLQVSPIANIREATAVCASSRAAPRSSQL